MEQDDSPPRWSDPVDPAYTAAGWTCWTILLAPLLAILWFVVVATVQHRWANVMSIFNTFADQVRAFSDTDLLAAYERTTGEPQNPEAAALLAEIERRGLDV